MTRLSPSAESQKIRQWLVKNLKGAPPAPSIQAARAAFDASSAQFPLPAGTLVEPAETEGARALWIGMPGADPSRVLLYLHGGAYVFGLGGMMQALAARLAGAGGCRALAVDYRLAPEHPFPAALEDATAAYRWLLEQGFPPGRVALAGDSAGGGLALATLVSCRDRGLALPAAAALLSPWTDLAGTGESLRTRADADPWLTPEPGGSRNARLYAGGEDLRHPLVSPLYADLKGLPPLLIHAGTDEILLDDSTRLADRARSAGVDVELDVWEGMWHVWHCYAHRMPEARLALDRIGAFLRESVREAS